MNTTAHTLQSLIDTNFLEYASYVIKDRAIPLLQDGLKPVHRRILHTLHEVDDGKFHKVANIVGHTMRYHPHGDASIEDALVTLAQKNYFIDQQGNFGNILTGDPASAARYIECRLSDLARETLFNPEVTEYIDSYDGRNRESVYLPAKVPVLLMCGTEGIAVGLSTRVLPHCFGELLEAQISILKGEDFEIYPDFPQGGLLDISQYQRGLGKVMVRARIDVVDNKTLVIREIPFGTTTESLIASIEGAIHKGKLKISSINDFTTEFAEIELKVGHGISAQELLPRLYLYSDCQVTHHLHPIVIRDQRPAELDVHTMLELNTQQLLDTLEKELRCTLRKLRRKHRDIVLLSRFIEEKVYQALETVEQSSQLKVVIKDQLKPFITDLDSPLSDDDIDKLLALPIRRISRYDAAKTRQELIQLEKEIARTEKDLSQPSKYAIRYLEALLKKYGERFPRRTHIEEFDRIDVRKVAIQDIKVGYDSKANYLGAAVKSDKVLMCSSYDKLLVFFKHGTYKVIDIPEKLFLKQKVLDFDRQSPIKTVSLIYLEKATGVSYMKRFQVTQFILDKEYPFLIEDSQLLYFSTDSDPIVRLELGYKPRARSHELYIDFKEQRVKGVSSRGNRVTERPILKVLKAKEIPVAIKPTLDPPEELPEPAFVANPAEILGGGEQLSLWEMIAGTPPSTEETP